MKQCRTLRKDSISQGCTHLQVYLVSPPPAILMPIPARPNQDDLRNPLRLKDLIAGKRASQALHLFDSRIRYWRYYLLIGPSPRWSKSLGIKLYRIVRDNLQWRSRAQRGVGRDLFNRCKFDRCRKPNDRELLTLVRTFKSQYKQGAQSFWEYAQNKIRSDVLLTASRQMQHATNYRGFFAKSMQTVPDGRARRAFHRLLLTQSNAANELGRLVLRSASVTDALAKIKPGTLHDEDARYMVLSWLLLSLLYLEDTVAPISTGRHSSAEPDEDETGELYGYERQLVRVALGYLNQGVDGLDVSLCRRIVEYLKHASKYAPYRAPIRVSPLNIDGSRRKLFADLRLTTFRNLLRSTKA